MFTKSARFYDAIYSFKDYAKEAAAVDELIQQRNPGARSLVDVACGTGKHLEFLDGYDRVGLDVDATLLDIARSRLPDVPLHEADMTSFDLGRRFDAVICLFSSIGYALTVERLDAAAARMAAHLEPGGVLVVEPWIGPDEWQDDFLGSLFVDEDDLKIARLNVSERYNGISRMDMHYLVGHAGEISYFSERHELGLFSHDDYAGAFERAGLAVDHDEWGLIGRGLYIGTAPRGSS